MAEFAYLADQYGKDRAELMDGPRWRFEAWSFQSCPFDPASRAFYIKDRSSYRAWGKNKQADGVRG